MNTGLQKISETLNLTPYQATVLRVGGDKYDLSRLVMRGGVLYVPYNSRNIIERAVGLIIGRRADLIGGGKILLRAQRRIKFFPGGFHCVRVGRFMYYADAGGAAISREIFQRATRNASGR